MENIQSFEEFFTHDGVGIVLWSFIINILITAVLSYLLGLIYIKYGKSMSNRRIFAKNFLLLATTTMLIITVVKSSLALSLGLVGALSIVRFRAAIKEPEELAYIFLTIAIGLGLGADQRLATICGVGFIVSLIVLTNYKNIYKGNDQNLILTITSEYKSSQILNEIVEILKSECTNVDLKRLDESEKIIEAVFFIVFQDFNSLNKIREKLQSIENSISLNFIDNNGII
jgi:hypothetical protein